ncbi:MAG: thermonuclease family protein [Candidatus Omnitrophica bacterium]|nr:thermonuclease family protein [Candidatus Omnitrophota bacterium]
MIRMRFHLFVFLISVSIIGFPVQGYSAPEISIEVKTYPQLLHAIRDVRKTSQQRIEQAVEQEAMHEAWETGKLIDQHILMNKTRADYGKKVFRRLSGDLGLSEAELGYRVQFARAYSIPPSTGELSWGHYRELLSINNAKERDKISKNAINKKWPVKKLRREIKRQRLRSEKEESKPVILPVPKLGKIFTYRVVKAVEGPFKGELVLDLGFFNYYKPDNLGRFKEGDILEIECEKHACIMKSVDVPVRDVQDALYTYQAYVVNTIDGDTVNVVIDLGFDFVTQQQLRLRSLNAPELPGSDGKAAKALLEKILSRDSGKILIKTSKREDQYGRFLAEIFLPSSLRGPEARGNPEYISINQELLDSGLLTVRESE